MRSTPKSWTPLGACLLATLAGGCVENEEEITVHPGGEVSVRLAARGDVADLSQGYALPLHGPFAPADAETDRWLATIGPDTGSPDVQARTEEGRWVAEPERRSDEAHLAVTAELQSIDDLPTHLAPPSEPYRTAFLERDASLEIERKQGRTVYVFRRAYRGTQRRVAGDHWTRALDEMPKHAVEDLKAATDEDLDEMARIAADAFRRYSEAFARDALAAVYVQGDASLPVAAQRAIVADVVQHTDRVTDAAELRELLRRLRAVLRSGEGGGDDGAADLEQVWRRTLRNRLQVGLREQGVSRTVTNAIRERLEWSLTAFDQAGDLKDETFRLAVEMPGQIVDGDYDEIDADGRAVWSFEGSELLRADVAMRVVSVVE